MKGMSPREARHLIDRSIRLLYERLSSRILEESFPRSMGPPPDLYSERILQVQTIAHAIAVHLHLDVRTIIVGFRSHLGAAARVELSPDRDLFVDVDSSLKYDYDLLVAILAHEVTHIFLYRAGIRYSDEKQNELLTDTAAAYLGLGAAILNGHKTQSFGTALTGTSKHIVRANYLSTEEFGYVAAERAYRFKEDLAALLTSQDGKAAFSRGLAIVKGRLRRPPYATASSVRRGVYELRARQALKRMPSAMQLSPPPGARAPTSGYSFVLDQGVKVRFHCAACNRGLQVPITNSRLEVRCPTCGAVHQCTT
jgi:hypothetical protein